MKKLVFVFLLLSGAVLIANAQDQNKLKVDPKDVPQSVKAAFENAFANASNVEWKMKDGKYKAKFELSGQKQFAELSNSGEVLSTGMKVEKDQLPSVVSDAVRTGNANKGIEEVYKVEKGGQTHYMVKLEGNPERLMYTADGKLLKEKTKQ
jgi:hypothetical protein